MISLTSLFVILSIVGLLLAITEKKGTRWSAAPLEDHSLLLQRRTAQVLDGSNASTLTTGKPTFYLHVGPHKTGTTFLQYSLCEQPEQEAKFFHMDNFVYLGTCSNDHGGQYVRHGAHSVFKHHLKIQPYIQLAQDGVYTEERKDYPLTDSSFFLSRIEQLRQENTSVLMVYEESSCFTDKMIEELKEFLSPTWNVKVLVVHRTFHDWLLSVHNQIHKLEV